jgi:hypothetical protein
VIKWLLGATVAVWIIFMILTNVFVGSMIASSMFVIGLLVIIAMNVQPSKQDDDDAVPYVMDGDLLEDFDDPYDEDERPESQPVRRSSVRTNPRRKAQT